MQADFPLVGSKEKIELLRELGADIAVAKLNVILGDYQHARRDAEQAWTPWGKVRIKPAQLGSRAALLGAIPLLMGASAS